MDTHLESFKPIQQKQVKGFILDVWKEYGFEYMSEYDSDLDNPYDFYIKPGGMFSLLKSGNILIGTIGVINRGNRVAELKRFYVEKHLRGKGFGSILYDHAIDFCKNHNYIKVEIETDKILKQGHVYYQKREFKIAKEDERSYYMEKDLTC